MADSSTLNSFVYPFPFVGYTVTLTDSSTLYAFGDQSIAPDAVEVPDNCKSVTVTNLSNSAAILLKVAELENITAGTMTTNNSVYIPALGSFTFDLGPRGQRFRLSRSNAIPGAEYNIFMRCVSGTAIQVNIAYVQTTGNLSPV